MATHLRRLARPVEQELFEEGYRYDFFQAVSLLERMRPDARPIGETDEPEHEAVQFQSHNGLSFPAGEVHSLERPADGEPARLNVTFMGLAGVFGPLPHAVTEVLLERQARHDGAFRRFLDIFNHRLISLFYRVRAKSRVALGFRPPNERQFSGYLYSFLGLGTPRLRNRMPVADRALLRYAGLLIGSVRSKHGLETLLTDYFGVRARIRPFVPQWLELDDSEQTAIGLGGRNNELGVSVVLGRRVWDQMTRFEITLGPMTLDELIGFLPVGARYRPLLALTRFYAGDEHEVDCVLLCQPQEVPAARLGSSTLMLGWTSWIGAKPRSEPGQVRLSRVRSAAYRGK